MAPHFSERDRELQARHAVVWRHRDLAEAAHMKPQSVSCIASAVYPLTVFRAWEFAKIQNSYTLLRSLAARAGALVVLRHAPLIHLSGFQLFTAFVASFSDFLPLAEKVRQGERLTDEQKIKLREAWEIHKQVGEAIVQQAEQQEDENKE